MTEVLLFAMALGSDAFVVSFAIGAQSKKDMTVSLAFRLAFFFGLGQGVMPFLGYTLSHEFAHLFQLWIPWISTIILMILGIGMIIEAFHPEKEKKVNIHNLKVVLLLALATSIDAIAAGFTLGQFSVNPYLSMVLMVICTFVMSILGIYLGVRGTSFLGKYAENAGGIILIMMAIKIMIGI